MVQFLTAPDSLVNFVGKVYAGGIVERAALQISGNTAAKKHLTSENRYDFSDSAFDSQLKTAYNDA